MPAVSSARIRTERFAKASWKVASLVFCGNLRQALRAARWRLE